MATDQTGMTSWPPPPPSVAPAPAGAKTEPFAIVALACSIAGIAFCPPIPSIVAVVFGHLALKRIRRTGDSGRGMALAGVIIGYVGIVVMLVGGAAFAAIMIFTISAQDRSNYHAAAAARHLGNSIQFVARREAIPPRSTRAVREALRESGLDPEEVSVGFFGGSAKRATRLRLISENWHLSVHSGVSGSACLTVPENTTGTISARRGGCPEP